MDRRWSPGGRVDDCVVWCWSKQVQSKSFKTKEKVMDCLRSRPLPQPFTNERVDEERGSGPLSTLGSSWMTNWADQRTFSTQERAERALIF